MNEFVPSFDESELSAEDLAVLRAFEAMDDWDASAASTVTAPLTSSSKVDPPSIEESFEDMLMLFVAEVEDDITRMRHALNQLEGQEQINPSYFVPLQRAAHKIRGTAGAIEYHHIATLAHIIELIVAQIGSGNIFPVIGVNALGLAVQAMEQTLEHIVTYGGESEQPLRELEAALIQRSIDVRQEAALAPESVSKEQEDAREQIEPDLFTTFQLAPSSAPLISTDARRVEQLLRHSERLIELNAALESAQAQVESALQELQATQTRLRYLEPMLSSLLIDSHSRFLPDETSTSSLIARILSEAEQEHEPPAHHRRLRSRLVKAAGSMPWDELDIERYSERDTLVRALAEAIADVKIASTRVHTAYAHLHQLLQEYITQTSYVRSDALLLKLIPFAALLPRLRQSLATIPAMQQGLIRFEVTGEATEIDQDILEALTPPLTDLLQTCIASILPPESLTRKREPHCAWLGVKDVGNEIVIEVGFSMDVNGGALDAIREPLRSIRGAINLERNTNGGVSFYLHFPRSQGAARYLQVRAGAEHVMVPFSQIQSISEVQREKLDIHYKLYELLGFPPEPSAPSRITPVLLMPQNGSRTVVGIEVEEIIDEVESVVKPLPAYLHRPGIAGAAVDGKGRVLPLLDLPELVSRYTTRQWNARTMEPSASASTQEVRRARVLIADDSVYQRHSLLRILKHANYTVIEAKDGMEALEQMRENLPDICLLDVEMPNLNGYDLLRLIRLHPELAQVKVIMLSTRSSEKHIRHAYELGARAYLTKPCPPEVLLETIQEHLSS